MTKKENTDDGQAEIENEQTLRSRNALQITGFLIQTFNFQNFEPNYSKLPVKYYILKVGYKCIITCF